MSKQVPKIALKLGEQLGIDERGRDVAIEYLAAQGVRPPDVEVAEYGDCRSHNGIGAGTGEVAGQQALNEFGDLLRVGASDLPDRGIEQRGKYGFAGFPGSHCADDLPHARLIGAIQTNEPPSDLKPDRRDGILAEALDGVEDIRCGTRRMLRQGSEPLRR